MESIDLIKKLEEIDRAKGGCANEGEDVRAMIVRILKQMGEDPAKFRKDGQAALRELRRRRAGKL
jgi:hypothetical protein